MKKTFFKQLSITLGVAGLLMLVCTQLVFARGFNQAGGSASLVGVGPQPVYGCCGDECTADESVDDGFDTLEGKKYRAFVLGARPFSNIFVNACGYKSPGYIAQNNGSTLLGPTTIIFPLFPGITPGTTCSAYVKFKSEFGNVKTNTLNFLVQGKRGRKTCPAVEEE